MSLLVNGSRFVTIPIFLEWLIPEDFLMFDSALCSSHWRQKFIDIITMYEKQFRSLILSTAPLIPFSYGLFKWCRRFSCTGPKGGKLEITKYCILQFQQLESDDAIKLCQFLSEVTSLVIDKCDAKLTESLEEILKHFHSLSETTISNTNGSVIDALFESLIRHCPYLASCNVSACTVVSQKSMLKLVQYYHQTLTSLDVSFCKHITNTLMLQLIAQTRGLTSLNVRGCCNVMKPTAALYFLMGPRLTSFGYKYFTSSTIRPFVWYHGNAIRTLDISNCNGVDDIGIIEISRACGNLSDLNIAYCNQVTDVGISSIAKMLLCLETLDLSWLSRVTQASFTSLMEAENHLTSLHLWNNSNIIASGLAKLCDKGSQLTSLSLVNLVKLSDTIFCDLMKSWSNVRTLNISESKLSNETHIQFSNCCKNITDLNLSLTAISSFALIHICKKFIHLTRLHLLNTTVANVHKSFVQEFSQYCPRLKYLSIKYCEALTGQSTVERILKSCRRLRVLIASVNSAEESHYLHAFVEEGDCDMKPRNLELIVNYKR